MLFLDTTLSYIKDAIALIGVLVISAGAIKALYQLAMLLFKNKYSSNYIRLQFGNNVILGLEFMVGGDIIGSLVQPDYYNLGLLAIIVLIRTVLSYFLNLELAELTPQQKLDLKK